MYFIIVGLLLIFRVGLFIYFVTSEGQYLRPDSALFMTLADNLLEHHIFSGAVEAPFEYHAHRTPGFPFFLALLKYLGIGSPYWVVFWQELIYGLSLGIFYHLGKPLFGKKITRIGLLFLLFEPSGIAYSKLILSEILFLPFFITGILLIGHYLQNLKWHYLIISGLILGIAILVRPALMYFPIVIFFTLILFSIRSRQRWRHAIFFLLTVILTVSPWVSRNYQQFGGFFLSLQQSSTLAYWHVPFVWESAKGIPFLKGQKNIRSKVLTIKKQYKEKHGYPLPKMDIYKTERDIALLELKKHPTDHYLQWFYGALKTSMGVNLTSLYLTLKIKSGKMDILRIQEVVFYKKILEYLKSQDKSILFVLVIRVLIAIFSLFGAIAIIKRKNCFLWIMMLANFYFIFIPGPMGNPRFRFPIEVFWFIQAYFGCIWLLSFWKDRDGRRIYQNS